MQRFVFVQEHPVSALLLHLQPFSIQAFVQRQLLNVSISYCRPLVLADGEAMSLDFGYSSVRRVFSSLKITNRSFRYASPHLWNQLPVSFRQPCTKHPADDDDVTLSNSPPTYSPLSPSITHSLFHSRLKTHLFH